MASFELGIARSRSSEFIGQTLPDGSVALFEVATKNVYSLNASAAAAWGACASPTTLPQLAAAMARQLNRPVSEDLAQEAVYELAAAGLVTVTPGERLGTSRRELLKQAAEVGIPLVLVLTAAEQRAHAQGAGSGPTTTPVPPTTTSTTTVGPTTTTTTTSTTTTTTTSPTTTLAPSGDRPFEIQKFVADSPQLLNERVPLEGAEFDVRNNQTNQIIGHITTGADGRATIMLTTGVSYTLIETHAPPSLDAYTPESTGPLTFTMMNESFSLDTNNIKKPPAG